MDITTADSRNIVYDTLNAMGDSAIKSVVLQMPIWLFLFRPCCLVVLTMKVQREVRKCVVFLEFLSTIHHCTKQGVIDQVIRTL
jgi:hypothetical protein